MRRVVVALLLVPLAACLEQPDEFRIEAPTWQVGDAWTYRTTFVAPGEDADGRVTVGDIVYLGMGQRVKWDDQARSWVAPTEPIHVAAAGPHGPDGKVTGYGALRHYPGSLGLDSMMPKLKDLGSRHYDEELGAMVTCEASVGFAYGDEPDPGFIPFPLWPGKVAEERTPFVGTDIVHRIRVGEMETVTVPGGTFDAVRLEMTWWHSAGLFMPEGVSPDDLKPAIVHFAPELGAVVRIEAPFLWYGGASSTDPPHARNHIMYEGQSSLVEYMGAPKEAPKTAGEAFYWLDPTAPCTGSDTYPEVHHPPRLSVGIYMDSGATQAGYPPETLRVHTYSQDVPLDEIDVTWKLTAGDDIIQQGPAPARSDGVYVTVELPRADLYRFEVEATHASGATASSSYLLRHGLDVDTTVTCGTLAPHTAACDRTTLPLGLGVSRVRAALDGDWMRPAAEGALFILDGDGAEVARHTTQTYDSPYWKLEVVPDWNIHVPGQWTVVWEPTVGHTDGQLSVDVWV